MTASAAGPERLGFRTKFLYGFGSVSIGVYIYFFALLLFFYNQVVGLDAGLVSLALSVSLVIDAVWDPLVGQISDGLRTRWGRRHPLMYFAAVPVAASVFALWNPPASFDATGKLVWLTVFVLLARLFVSIYEVPASALAPELAPDYHDRTVVMSYRWVFLILGGAVATMLGSFIFFHPTAAYPQGQLNPAAWGPMSVTAAVLMGAPILISALGTHDRIASLHRPTGAGVPMGQALRTVFAVLSNWNLGVSLGASLIAGLSYGLYLGLALYIETYFWGLKASEIGFLQLANLVAVFPGAFVANALARRLGKKRACMGVFFFGALVTQAPILARLLGAFPGPGDPTLVPLLAILRLVQGVLVNAGYIVVTSMIADITEDAQVKTGRRAEGLLMAANTFITKVTTGVSALLPGVLLAFVHFPAKATAAVSPALVNKLVWVYLPLTTTLSMLSIATWALYRIDQAAHERNLASVREAAALADAAAEGVAPPLRAAE